MGGELRGILQIEVELDAADRTPMLLYQRADRALYRAKSEGRDRTAIG